MKRLAVPLLLLACVFAHAADTSETLTRIAHVENGLRGPVAIKGQPTPGWRLADRLRELRVPGVSIAVIDRGTLAWARAYGVADAATGRALTPDSRMQAASISKTVSAAAILALAGQGKLDLDADVDARLTSWKIPANGFTAGAPVTLRALLSHTAGTSTSGFRGYAAGEAVPTVPQVLDGLAPANSAPVRVVARPGEKFSYSGGGYTIVQQLATDTTGLTFPDLMRATVLAPLGMDHSTYEQPLPPAWQDEAAYGHDGKAVPVPGRWHVHPERAAAGLWTTPADLARFAIGIQEAAAGKPGAILPRALAETMLTPVMNGYGLGTMLSGEGAAKKFAHTGGNMGYRTMLVGYAATGQGAVLMTNGDNGMTLIDELLRAIAAEYGWPDYRVVERTLGAADPAVFPQLAGNYTVPAPAGALFSLTTAGGRLYLSSPSFGAAPLELLPEADGRWFAREQDVTFRFRRGQDGQVADAEVTYRQGKPRIAVRTPPAA